MKHLIATLVLVGLWSHSLEGHKIKLFHRYAKMKILEQCYGAELTKEWQEWMSARVQECQESRTTRSADDSHEFDSVEDLHAAVLSPEQFTARKQKKEKKLRMLNCIMEAMNVMGKSCRPPPASLTAVDPALPAKIAFMRCEMRARLQSCMFIDVKKNKDMFKMGAIEDMLSGHHDDDFDDMYDDDDDDDDDV
ncbi:hypothetical protein FHG87_015751 [Trinorchestia longiramus]|nr:hypothetical protein FHG87_015751 [Trinorchestia longiramus]